MVAGANPAEIAQIVYMSHPKSKLELLAMVLETLEIHPSQKIAWVLLTQEMLNGPARSSTDTEGLVNYPLSIDGVVAVAFFREEGKHRYRISLRSKDNFDVASAAEFFGGGGHTNAAGLWAEGSYEEVRDKVIGQVEQLSTNTSWLTAFSLSTNPAGLTSHDVVYRVRRLFHSKVGHTGTLDPLATGVLVLLLGRATRLARFLRSDEKEYPGRDQTGDHDRHLRSGGPHGE